MERERRPCVRLHPRGTQASRDHTAGVEPERHLLQPHQALHQQGREHDQHRGQTGLRDDEPVPPPLARRAEDAPSALRQRRQQIGPRSTGGGRHAEEHATRNRDEQSEAENGPVETDFVDAWNRRRDERAQRLDREHRDRQSADAADDRQREALGEQLSRQTGGTRAERRAERELPQSARGTREQQVGDVRTGDQEHDADGAK
jgi:hypothetical protein